VRARWEQAILALEMKRHFVSRIRGDSMKVLMVEAEEAVLKSTGIMLNKFDFRIADDFESSLR
jgi:hypothetical protein